MKRPDFITRGRRAAGVILLACVCGCAAYGGGYGGGGAAAPSQPLTLIGTTWRMTEIDGRQVDAPEKTSLTFEEEGHVVGVTGCNRFAGSAAIDGASLSFSPLAGTRMACEASLMQQEQRFYDAAGQVSRFSIDASGRMHLLDAAGTTRVLLERAP